MADPTDPKRELRRTMRVVRRQAALEYGPSAAIVDRLDAMPEVAAARTVMLFDPVPGEPDPRALGDRLRARGTVVVVPRPEPRALHPIDASVVDVVIVPGVAFTREGDRLGQGGGWYDRFLAGVRPDCTVIGICFDEQLVDDVPTQPHDVRMVYVVTPTVVHRRRDALEP